MQTALPVVVYSFEDAEKSRMADTHCLTSDLACGKSAERIGTVSGSARGFIDQAALGTGRYELVSLCQRLWRDAQPYWVRVSVCVYVASVSVIRCALLG